MIPNQYKVRLQNSLVNWYPIVPHAQKAMLERTLTFTNIQRLRIAAWLSKII